ncbi:uncharacterized protein LTR77_002389 [Saxophila tyrrhenica]|uniref:Glucose-methanol-choline oxidoreductase N-terminal domain-containing protein n=1 Tax=Saxophila tyrrhenica TaxID=1690608 RepID=A0AAV9PN89_9PEZI|nr:hypothetical protein LTR77_002389 [Saxophila tyrrhenica]
MAGNSTVAKLCYGLLFGVQLVAALSRRQSGFDAENPYNERLQSLSLLGSHFGLIDIPQTFDYIVVGGGTGGLTVANRLAENNTVAVIEAGGFYEIQNSNLTEVPANSVYYLGKAPLWNNPLIDWFQQTTPQAGLNDDSVLFSQGHTLGGGSARNFMWYQRGARTAYSQWANMTGDDSWSFDSFNEFMKKPVQFTPPESLDSVPPGCSSSPAKHGNGKGHGPPATAPGLSKAPGLAKKKSTCQQTPLYDESDYNQNGGPLQVSYARFLEPSNAYIGAGLSELGLKQLPGMVDGNLLGWMNCADTIDPITQTRSSSETSMLRDAIKKNFNLQIFTETLAKKILFNDNKRAYGVELEVSGIGSGKVNFMLNATKEVIVSAGAFRSPQLLMVSGVGPSQTLSDNGIEEVSALEGVGQGMMDHIWSAITREVDVETIAYLADPDYLAAQNAEYIESRTGMNTNPGGTIISFERLPEGSISQSTRDDLDAEFGGDWPDVEYFNQDAYASTNDDYLLSAPDFKNYTAMAATIIAPFSRGNVTINSKDTADHPLVNPNWLTDPRDMEILIAAFKRVRQLFETKAMQPALIGGEVYPGEDVQTDAQIEAIIRRSADTVFHPACTCRMGQESDDMAVLDSKARVFGTKGLRVVDASSFPKLIPGHPQGTVYGLAEKIAYEILNGD